MLGGVPSRPLPDFSATLLAALAPATVTGSTAPMFNATALPHLKGLGAARPFSRAVLAELWEEITDTYESTRFLSFFFLTLSFYYFLWSRLL